MINGSNIIYTQLFKYNNFNSYYSFDILGFFCNIILSLRSFLIVDTIRINLLKEMLALIPQRSYYKL